MDLTIHGEASYIHDLRAQMFQKDETSFDGHPEQGLGEQNNIQKYRKLIPNSWTWSGGSIYESSRKEDNFNKIVSLSSPSKGRYLMAKKYFDKIMNGIIWNLKMVI